MALRDGPVGWKILVDDMVLRGAQLGPQETATVIQYLSGNFGPAAGPMPVGKSETRALPSGPGQDLIQTHCTVCHDLSRVTGSKRSKPEWSYTVTKVSGMATPKEIETMSSYLAAQFWQERGVTHSESSVSLNGIFGSNPHIPQKVIRG